MHCRLPQPDRDYIRSLFDYDPDSGTLSRKGTDNPVGYRIGQRFGLRIDIDYKTYWVHHIIWLWMEGTWPNRVLHVNRNPRDNRWENLYVPYYVKESTDA